MNAAWGNNDPPYKKKGPLGQKPRSKKAGRG